MTGRSVRWNERSGLNSAALTAAAAGCPEARFPFLLFLLGVRELKRMGHGLDMPGKARSSQKHTGRHRDTVTWLQTTATKRSHNKDGHTRAAGFLVLARVTRALY